VLVNGLPLLVEMLGTYLTEVLC